MDYLEVGVIVGTHGIKGEIRIKSNFSYKELIFKKGFKLYIGKSLEEVVVNTYRVHKEFDMITMDGFSNINEVLKYKRSKVFINRDDLDISFYDSDYVGMEVMLNNEVLGKIVDIYYNKNKKLLVVEGDKNFYIPLEGDFIKEVDTNKQIIIVDEIVRGLMI